jgi:hypothetical protein
MHILGQFIQSKILCQVTIIKYADLLSMSLLLVPLGFAAGNGMA